LRNGLARSLGSLVWARRFEGTGSAPLSMVSIFEPVGVWPDGYWIERSGAMQFKLTVDVRDGAWHWRVQGARLHGIPLPIGLLPQSHAYKRIEEGGYRFEVMFAAPILGPLPWYRGLLQLAPGDTTSPSSPADSPHP